MRIRFSEQDVKNAICVHVAAHEAVSVYDVDVDLRFETGMGIFHAYADHPEFIGIRERQHYNQQRLTDAIAYYLSSWYNFKPEQMEITFEFVEGFGIEADIMYWEA